MTDPSARRLPIRVRLPYSTRDEFIARYGVHVDETSLFIATKTPKPLGTLLSFELVLADASRLMRGEGEVAQVFADGSGQRPGMRVHFTRVDQATQALVSDIVASRTGAAPLANVRVEATEPTPVASEAPAAAPTPTPETPPAPIAAEPVAPAADAPAPEPAQAPRVTEVAAPALPTPRPVSRDLVLGLALTPTSADIAILRDGGARRLGSLAVAPFSDPTFASLEEPLRALRSAVEEELGLTLPRIVVAVPTATSATHREALRRALQTQGLECLRLLNLPSALALALAGGRTLARQRILVMAVSAEICDVALGHITGDEYEAVATHTGPVSSATIDVTRMLEAARVQPTALDELVIVGDASSAVRSELERLTGKTARPELDAAALSHGAALFGAALILKERGKPSASASEILGLPVTLATRHGTQFAVFEALTRVPAEKNLTLPAAAGSPITLALRSADTFHSCVQLSPDRTGELTVRFRLDTDGQLSLTAESALGRAVPITALADPTSTDSAPPPASYPDLGPAPATAKGLFSGLKKMFGR